MNSTWKMLPNKYTCTAALPVTVQGWEKWVLYLRCGVTSFQKGCLYLCTVVTASRWKGERTLLGQHDLEEHMQSRTYRNMERVTHKRTKKPEPLCPVSTTVGWGGKGAWCVQECSIADQFLSIRAPVLTSQLPCDALKNFSLAFGLKFKIFREVRCQRQRLVRLPCTSPTRAF